MYLKSLDHMGLQIRGLDKKNLAAKFLVDSIKTKHEEQRRQKSQKNQIKHQYSWAFPDQEVVCDILRLLMVFASNTSTYSNNERARMTDFFEKFLVTFFAIPEDFLDIHLQGLDRGSPEEEEDTASTDLPNGRVKKGVNGKKNDLRRGVLEKSRNGAKGRGYKDNNARSSKESDDESAVDEEMTDAPDGPPVEVTNERWGTVPEPAVRGAQTTEKLDTYKVDESMPRLWYSLYCNQTLYVFFYIFQTLYNRFAEIKACETQVGQVARRARVEKPAHGIGLLDINNNMPPLEEGELYYDRTIGLVEDFLKGRVDENKYHDYLRTYYLSKGWTIYTVADLLKAMCRLGAVCCTNDKEKTADLLGQFYRDREHKETSYNAEINLRKQADKYIKDGESFLIRWVCAIEYLPEYCIEC